MFTLGGSVKIADGQVVLFDKIDTAFTYLNEDTGLFKVVNVPMLDDLEEYCELASKTAKEQKEYFTGPLGNDVFQYSSIPWITYTHIRIQILVRKKMPHLFLTGENITKKKENF